MGAAAQAVRCSPDLIADLEHLFFTDYRKLHPALGRQSVQGQLLAKDGEAQQQGVSPMRSEYRKGNFRPQLPAGAKAANGLAEAG